MTKSELIEEVADRIDVPKSRASAIVNAIFDSMRGALVADERIELRGFGSFSIRNYDARVGRNPRTGEKVQVPPKKSVHFKVGKELKQRVDSLNEYE